MRNTTRDIRHEYTYTHDNESEYTDWREAFTPSGEPIMVSDTGRVWRFPHVGEMN